MNKPTIQELLNEEDNFDLCDGVFLYITNLHGNMVDANQESKLERIVTLVWHIKGIIGNGGFRFLFEGDFEGDPGFVYTAAAFSEIGCDQAAEAFKEALGIFPGNLPPEDLDERLEIYLKYNEKTRDRINEKFWGSSDDITAKLATYIRANRVAFEHLL